MFAFGIPRLAHCASDQSPPALMMLATSTGHAGQRQSCSGRCEDDMSTQRNGASRKERRATYGAAPARADKSARGLAAAAAVHSRSFSSVVASASAPSSGDRVRGVPALAPAGRAWRPRRRATHPGSALALRRACPAAGCHTRRVRLRRPARRLALPHCGRVRSSRQRAPRDQHGVLRRHAPCVRARGNTHARAPRSAASATGDRPAPAGRVQGQAHGEPSSCCGFAQRSQPQACSARL